MRKGTSAAKYKKALEAMPQGWRTDPSLRVVTDAEGSIAPRFLDEDGHPTIEWRAGGQELGYTPAFGYVYFDIVETPAKDWPFYEPEARNETT